MKKAREVHSQLIDIMKSEKVAYKSSNGSWDVVRKAICSAYFYNSARIKGKQVLELIESMRRPSLCIANLSNIYFNGQVLVNM